MSWVLAIAVAWMLLAAAACLLVGRAIQLADRMEPPAAPGPDAPNVVTDQIPQTAAPMAAVAALADAVPAARSASDQPARPSGAPRRLPAPRRAGGRRHPSGG